MVEEMVNGDIPVKHLRDKLMTRAQDMDAQEVVEKMGDKIPAEVAALVKSTKHHRSQQPFSEKSLHKARKILNGMVEEAQVQLDKKMIACKEFYDRNRGMWKQIRTDLSRLGEQIADLIRLIADSNKGIQETESQIAVLEEERGIKTKEYMTIKSADDIEMTSRRNDLAVAEFILKFTICSDKKPPAMLAQKSATQWPTLGVLKCEDENSDMLEFRFEDPKLQAEAEKILTPGARKKLQEYLGYVHAKAQPGASLLQLPGDDNESVDDEVDDLLEESEPDGEPKRASVLAVKQSVSKHDLDAPDASEITTMPPSQIATPAPKITPPAKKPKSKMSRKCSLGKPNCGLLHDNMS